MSRISKHRQRLINKAIEIAMGLNPGVSEELIRKEVKKMRESELVIYIVENTEED